ncbi:MAG: hypothetical protein ABS80_07035 [Pseudonocardia sp. SCN 72-51]|nr:MAG: hypothetical protein ABS80_07035 [Pseudonocardia sp. SCN 72-51]
MCRQFRCAVDLLHERERSAVSEELPGRSAVPSSITAAVAAVHGTSKLSRPSAHHAGSRDQM